MALEDFAGFDVLAGNEKDLAFANKRRRSAQYELADALDESNEKLIQYNSEHYNTTSLHMKRAGELQTESDKLTHNIRVAQADPWHDLKVLFTDQPSISDYAAEQNRIQGEMNQVSNRYQQDVYKYQFNLSQIQQELGALITKRDTATQSAQAIGSFAANLSAQIGARASERQAELDSMSFQEIVKVKAEQDSGIDVKAKYGMAPWEVEQQYRKWVLLDKEGKGRKDAREEMEFWMDWLPPQAVETHLASTTGKAGTPYVFTTPDGKQIKYNTQQLQEARNRYRKRQEETAKATTEGVRGPVAGKFASERFDQVMNRWISATPTLELYKKNPKTGEVERDLTVLPPAIRTEIEQLTGIEMQLQQKYERLDQMADIQLMPGEDPERIANLESERSSMARETNALEHARASLYKQMEDTIVAEAQRGFSNDDAKTAIESYIRTGRMEGYSKDTSAYLFEALVSNPTLGSKYSSLAPGFAEMGQIMHKNAVAEFEDSIGTLGEDAIALFDPDADEEQRQLAMVQWIAGATKVDVENVMSRVYTAQQVDANGNKVGNVYQSMAMQAWSREYISKGVNDLMLKYKDAEQTRHVLKSVLGSNGRIADRYLTSQDGFINLMRDLSLASFNMHKSGAMDKKDNLARELYDYLLDTNANGAYVRNLTTPTNREEAGLAAKVFNNNQHAAFLNQVQANMGGTDISQVLINGDYGDQYDRRQLALDMMQKDGIGPSQATPDVMFQYMRKVDDVIRKLPLPSQQQKEFDKRQTSRGTRFSRPANTLQE